MHPKVREQLLALNRSFYEHFATSFAATRFGAQPGFEHLLPYVPDPFVAVDLGCGNARLLRFLGERRHSGVYWGVDLSLPLLAIARQQALHVPHVRAHFLALDLSQPRWACLLPRDTFDVAFALAVLHHIPGRKYREMFVQEAASLVRPKGYLILSTWRFLHIDRMRRKIVPWQRIGLQPSDVEPGDYLLDWKRDGIGYRYVHHVTVDEIAAWAAQAGLTVVETFHSDGREGDLSLYAVLQKMEPKARAGNFTGTPGSSESGVEVE